MVESLVLCWLAVASAYAADPRRLPARSRPSRGRQWTWSMRAVSIATIVAGFQFWPAADDLVAAGLGVIAALSAFGPVFVVLVNMWPRLAWATILVLPGVWLICSIRRIV